MKNRTIYFLSLGLFWTAFFQQQSALAVTADATNKISGVTIYCNILNDDSLEVTGTNTNNTDYTCDITCKGKDKAGNSVEFSCTAVLPKKTTNGQLCTDSKAYSSISDGSYTCK